EHSTPAPRHQAGAGSSPLARGARSYPRWYAFKVGLIPASAGSTSARGLIRSRDGGSSPLARGARGELLRDEGENGLIPASAGSTRQTVLLSRCPAAHPR